MPLQPIKVLDAPIKPKEVLDAPIKPERIPVKPITFYKIFAAPRGPFVQPFRPKKILLEPITPTSQLGANCSISSPFPSRRCCFIFFSLALVFKPVCPPSRHSERDVFSWDFLIRACIQYRDTRRALDLFDQMQHEAFLPDKVIYSSALIACSTDPDSFCTGQKLHARIVASPFILDIVLRTALVSLYNKCGNVDHAQQLFHGISEHDEVSCNAMIEAYVGHGHGEEALNVYEKMQWEGLMANASTFVSLLSLCVNTSKLTLGKVIHVKVLENGVEADVRVATALVSMYGRCGGLEHAQKLFATSGERDVVMWNALLAAYAQNGHSHDALVVYEQMQQEGFLPERVTFVSVLQACSTESMFVQGQQVHACIKSWGHDLDLVVGNALVTMYSSRGKIEYAQSVFEKLPEKDVVSWTAMITACAQQGHAKGAWQFLYRMHQEGIMPNEVTLVSVISAYASLADPIECRHFHTWLVANDYACVGDIANALISMYAKSGCLKDAQDLFSQLAEKDSISWNALISACAQNAHGEDALRLYEQMHMEGVLADSAAFASVLAACAEHADLLKGQQMHVQILNIELDLDDAVWNSILNMYGKCGVIMKAYSMFNEMASRNLISWNSMIAGCAQHGEGKHALGLLLKMVQTGVQPDSTTFMSVLAACSHSGLLNEGLCMIIMIRCLERVVTLDHLNCFIDALGRLGRIADAWDLMVRMPFQPTRASHIGLLNACRHHVDVKLGQAATRQALELVPEDTALPVLMSNLYGMAGAEEFTGMQETCVMSNCGPGC
eukprot:c19050_g1_i1 orf=628-2976(-)